MSMVNKVRYKQFLQQANGAKIFEIHVKREDKKSGGAVLKFNGRAARGNKRVTGEWALKGEDAETLKADTKTFLDMARKSFLVHRGEGLEDEFYADPEQEAKLAQS